MGTKQWTHDSFGLKGALTSGPIAEKVREKDAQIPIRKESEFFLVFLYRLENIFFVCYF